MNIPEAGNAKSKKSCLALGPDRICEGTIPKNYLSFCCCFSARGMVTVATGDEGLVKMV